MEFEGVLQKPDLVALPNCEYSDRSAKVPPWLRMSAWGRVKARSHGVAVLAMGTAAPVTGILRWGQKKKLVELAKWGNVPFSPLWFFLACERGVGPCFASKNGWVRVAGDSGGRLSAAPRGFMGGTAEGGCAIHPGAATRERSAVCPKRNLGVPQAGDLRTNVSMFPPVR